MMIVEPYGHSFQLINKSCNWGFFVSLSLSVHQQQQQQATFSKHLTTLSRHQILEHHIADLSWKRRHPPNINLQEKYNEHHFHPPTNRKHHASS